MLSCMTFFNTKLSYFLFFFVSDHHVMKIIQTFFRPHSFPLEVFYFLGKVVAALTNKNQLVTHIGAKGEL